MMVTELQPEGGRPERRRRPAPFGLAAALLPGGRAAAAVALERDVGPRLRRIGSVVADRVATGRRPRRARMRALVVGGGRLSWREVPEPADPGPAGAVVAPLAMATCDLDRPLGLGRTPFPLPLQLGHECVAEVVSVGAEVASVAPGDRVVVPFQISCGSCQACRHGLSGNCRAVPPLSMYGFGIAGGLWGGVVADRVAVPYADAMLVPLPTGVDPAPVASAGDTLSDAYRHVAPHVDRVRRHPDGPRVIVVGAVSARSPFGSSVPLYTGLMVQALLPEADLLLVDARPSVRAHADRLGLPAVPPAGLGRRTAALVLDSSADPRGLRLAVGATAPDGFCSCAGSLHGTVRVPGAQMFGRNVTLSIARSHIRQAIPEVLALVAADRLRPGEVTTTLATYDDAPEALQRHLVSHDVKTVLVRR